MRHASLHLALLGLLLCAALPPADAAPAQVIVYRCTDAAGRLSLRDSPCRRGEQQQVRPMLRPTDPPPTRARISGPVPGRDAPAPTRLVYVTPPRPVYECTTPDGERYTSASPEGNPRWMPVWAPGYAAGPYPVDRGSYGAGVEYRSGGTTIRIGGGRDWRYPMPVVPVYGPAGTWIRDTCSLLPPAEVCMRLRDRRDALDRRYNSALQSERDAITREQRGIDAQLAGECRA